MGRKKKDKYLNGPGEYQKEREASNWSTGDEHKFCTSCDYVEKLMPEEKIIIPMKLYLLFKHICKEIKSEWQMLLVGTKDGDRIRIVDYYIPQQTVTFATVKNEECIDAAFIAQHSIIATLHSHSSMATGFSRTDVEMTNLSSPLQYHIVTNNDGEYTAAQVITLPCSMKTMQEIAVLIEWDTPDIIGLEKIKRENGFAHDDKTDIPFYMRERGLV